MGSSTTIMSRHRQLQSGGQREESEHVRDHKMAARGPRREFVGGIGLVACREMIDLIRRRSRLLFFPSLYVSLIHTTTKGRRREQHEQT